MKKDIQLPEVVGVYVAVVETEDPDVFEVHIINENDLYLDNMLIMSTGYGENNGEKVKTSTLRYHIEQVPPKSAVKVELIKSDVFHLNNQYWITFYVGKQIYDKKYIFLPDSIVEANFSNVPFLDKQGVLHS